MELPDSPCSPVSSLSRHCCRQVPSPSQSRSSLWGWIWQAPKNCQLHRIRHRLKSRRIGMLCSGTCRARVEWNPVRGCISLRSSGLDLLPGFRELLPCIQTSIHPSYLRRHNEYLVPDMYRSKE